MKINQSNNPTEWMKIMYTSKNNRRKTMMGNINVSTNRNRNIILSMSRKCPKITIFSNHPFMRTSKVISIMEFSMTLSLILMLGIDRRRNRNLLVKRIQDKTILFLKIMKKFLPLHLQLQTKA